MKPADLSHRKPIPWSAAPLLLPVVGMGAGILLAAALDYGYRSYFALGTVIGCLPAIALFLRPVPKPSIATAASLLLVIGVDNVG